MSATPVKDGSTSSSDHPVALEVRAARKSFGHVTALQGASLTLRRGEVTALVGDNGAGKSTLVKVISGVIQPDSGSIHVAGEEITMRDPQAGRAKGIHTVFQDLALVDPLSTTENMFLGDEIRTKVGPFTLPWLNRRAMRRETRRALGDLRVTTLKDVEVPIEMLSGGQRQSVAIARAVREQAAVVLLDEPTAALGVSQAEQVLELIGRLREQGTAVMVISHNLREVFAVADRIVVMRLGRIAANFTVANTNEEEVVSAIVGTRREPDADADSERSDQ
ncbi:MAG TPA: ATP-binding cassette domain-containing protein [Solirubrobacterales bacterium]|nr:ATP-binding cassette domain-containing protein [Solirubrobacterales bacterium]